MQNFSVQNGPNTPSYFYTCYHLHSGLRTRLLTAQAILSMRSNLALIIWDLDKSAPYLKLKTNTTDTKSLIKTFCYPQVI